MNPLFSIDRLSVSIEQTSILKELSFQIEAGTWTGILGPNGSGKTTLLRALSGALPYAGEIQYNERPLKSWNRKELARQLAVLQQAPGISFDFTVEDFVLLGRMPHKKWLERDTPEDRERVHQILADLELSHLAGRNLPSLSGGERQRVYLARALAQETAVLFLDEPTSHLDVYYQFDLLKRLRALVDAGKTVVAVFHDLELAARFSDQVLVLQEGELVATGPPAASLTDGLIRRVFRMETRRVQTADHPLYFHYLDTLPDENLHTNR